uniref:pyrroline-5-carboxylate reductase n=1 Tax=Timema poppense TaxID=170557 RepID=A0A7R9D5Z7_TIMPO|nr:unnamed protein product [Timema poppensis]
MSIVSCYFLDEAHLGADVEPRSLRSFGNKSSRDVYVVWSLVVDQPNGDRIGYALENTDVTVLAMKPQYLDSVIDNLVLSHPLPENHIFISILVGVTLETLQRVFHLCSILSVKQKLSRFIKSPRVAKVIPNTPMMVQEGCSVFCCTHPADNEIIALVQAIFSKGGICEMIPEPLMNAMGALSGSGPAFVYMIIEALSDGAVKMGIPREMSTRFAAQTLLGAAKMVLETGKHPGQLKDEVCSPGGSTICGVHALELGGLSHLIQTRDELEVVSHVSHSSLMSSDRMKPRHALIDAIEAATKRSEEIGKQK